MIYIILALLLVLFVVYILLPENKIIPKYNKLPFNIYNPLQSINNSTTSNSICGKKNLYCKNRLIRPYMFRNLSKDYVDNQYIDWQIELLDESQNLYRMNLSDKYCAYNIDNDICLFEIDGSTPQHTTDTKPGCKKTNLCSLSSIIDNTPHFDTTNTHFIIKQVETINTPNLETGYTIQNLNGKYICNINNRMSITDDFSDDCVWQFK